jgi:hypothetical protein
MNWRCFFNRAAVSGFKALVSARPATAGNIASQNTEKQDRDVLLHKNRRKAIF